MADVYSKCREDIRTVNYYFEVTLSGVRYVHYMILQGSFITEPMGYGHEYTGDYMRKCSEIINEANPIATAMLRDGLIKNDYSILSYNTSNACQVVSPLGHSLFKTKEYFRFIEQSFKNKASMLLALNNELSNKITFADTAQQELMSMRQVIRKELNIEGGDDVSS